MCSDEKRGSSAGSLCGRLPLRDEVGTGTAPLDEPKERPEREERRDPNERDDGRREPNERDEERRDPNERDELEERDRENPRDPPNRPPRRWASAGPASAISSPNARAASPNPNERPTPRG